MKMHTVVLLSLVFLEGCEESQYPGLDYEKSVSDDLRRMRDVEAKRTLDARDLQAEPEEMIGAPEVFGDYVSYSFIPNDPIAAADYYVTSQFEQDPVAEVPPVALKRKSIDLGNGFRMELVLIPAGTFDMGSEDSEVGRIYHEGPVRRVQITKPFYMGIFEVTQDQYMAVTGKNPSNCRGHDLPVEGVSWDEAAAFCRQVGGRLPTEAEWEYACRAGTRSRFHFGDNDNLLHNYAWCTYNSGSRTWEVGRKRPNAWGLYDTAGNVWEWCQDWYADSYHGASCIDPQGPPSGEYHVYRGGGCCNFAVICRSAFREYGGRAPPPGSGNYVGFRVVLGAD